jgi:hypothetical protein
MLRQICGILNRFEELLPVPMPNRILIQRKFEEGPGEPDVTEEVVSNKEDDDDGATSSLAVKVDSDDTVEQEDVDK